jgi:AraC-like DNA-binding protein/ligand-binding sensor protein
MRFDTLEDFSVITDVGVAVMDIRGELCYVTSAYEHCRTTLSYVSQLLDNEEMCRVSAIYNSYQSKRFGGRFIFYCPRGFVFFASPLIRGGRHDLTVIGGPVLMSGYDDYIEVDIAKQVVFFDKEALLKVLKRVPVMDVRKVTALSEQLFVNALHLSDSDYLTAMDAEPSYRLREYMRSIDGVPARDDDYQTGQEQKLIKALALHDEAPARALLNSIIGHILFHSGKNLELVRSKMLEFTVLLSQTAMKHPGADMEYIFGPDNAVLSEIDNLESMDGIVVWLNELMSRFSAYIFDKDSHSSIVYKTVAFMRHNYWRENVTLKEMARFLNVTEPYLSKIFKLETGYTVNHYINMIRVNESKRLMADRSLNVLMISGMVGFRDPSYFTKVFKRWEGISPYHYKKRLAEKNEKAEKSGKSGKSKKAAGGSRYTGEHLNIP